jgi:hypothetical protein
MATVKRFCQWALGRHYPAVPVVLGLLLALPSLWGGLQMDDYTIRTAVMESELAPGISTSRWQPFTFLDGDPVRTGRAMDAGLLPWWTDPECRLAFWRPLSAATHQLDFRVWPRHPWLMHLQSLAWFGLLIWTAAVLYRRILSAAGAAWAAALAAVLFAVDDAHVFPAAWLANRNVLLAGTFGFLALVAYDRWRRDGWRPGAWLAPISLLAALLAKESAVSVGGYLLAYAVFLDRASWRSRFAALLPSAVVGIAWYGVYKMLGFGAAGSGVYVDPASDPIGFLHHVAWNGPILLLAQWGMPGSDLSMAISAAALKMHWLWAVFYLALVALLLFPLVRRDATARFWTMGMLLSLLPACLAFPMDRLLVFVGLGAMGLLAQVLAGWKEGAVWLSRRSIWRKPAGVFMGALVAVHLVLAPVFFLLLTISLPRLLGNDIGAISRGFPGDPQVSGQTVVIVNPFSLAMQWLLLQQRRFDGEPVPRRGLLLTGACSDASITRTDDRTLLVRVRGGLLPRQGQWPDNPRPPLFSPVYGLRMFDRLVRGDRKPFEPGQVIALETATIEITELAEDGRVAEVRFRFPVPLEAPALRWLRATGDGFVPFEPPAVGETVEVGMAHLRKSGR